MKRTSKVSYIICFFILCLCCQAMALRVPSTWKGLQNSDFIVLARVTKIEELGEGQYESTYTVLRTYKGDAPKSLNIKWAPHKRSSIGMNRIYHCSFSDMSADFIIFAKKEENGYAMHEERFMRKISKYSKYDSSTSTPVDLYKVKNIPQELSQKIVIKKYQHSDYVQKYLEWETIKDWLENEYPNKR